MKIAILGGTGMLGNAVLRAFAEFSEEVIVSTRRLPMGDLRSNHTAVEFDAASDDLESTFKMLSHGDVVINCIGIIKTEIDEHDDSSKSRAQVVNTLFPKKLAAYAEKRGFNVIQIATDCVYSGLKGPYDEDSNHDPDDWYGKTKSAGEVQSPRVMQLRVSIIGRETRGFSSLFEWVSRQAQNSRIIGFTNHLWNGVPADVFGRIARGIAEEGLFRAGTYHLVPNDWVTKAELVELIAKHEHRSDIQITNGPASKTVDRRLATKFEELNKALWIAGGYSSTPTVSQLVSEI